MSKKANILSFPDLNEERAEVRFVSMLHDAIEQDPGLVQPIPESQVIRSMAMLKEIRAARSRVEDQHLLHADE